MKGERKRKAAPMNDLARMRRRVAKLEADCKRAEEELERTFKILRRAMKGTIYAMALIVEIKDPYTAEHQRRVAKLASAIARKMILSKDEIERIQLTAAIHDVGRIYIPPGILGKPTRLTDVEFSMVKTHPKVGYDILKMVQFPWPIAQIVLQHHERMDGSGYPRGLSRNDILLDARILAVADVVEALASPRPYRPARVVDKALEEISKNKGVLYDPKVADACSKVFADRCFKLE